MRALWPSALLMVAVVTSAQTAKFGVDGVTSTPSTIVATIQPRVGAPGYSWLRVYFYSSLTGGERANAGKGLVESIRTAWAAVLQFTVDKTSTVWQIDLSLPGHTCTIAESDTDARRAFQEFLFDGRRLRVKGSGSFVCVMTPAGVPKRTFEWDVNFETPVIDRSVSILDGRLGHDVAVIIEARELGSLEAGLAPPKPEGRRRELSNHVNPSLFLCPTFASLSASSGKTRRLR